MDGAAAGGGTDFDDQIVAPAEEPRRGHGLEAARRRVLGDHLPARHGLGGRRDPGEAGLGRLGQGQRGQVGIGQPLDGDVPRGVAHVPSFIRGRLGQHHVGRRRLRRRRDVVDHRKEEHGGMVLLLTQTSPPGILC
ncbi:MAG: hypothetical protein FD126_3779, partial [Elusimicrobia bacterium]